MQMETRRDVFQAIADPTRREIIRLIASRPLTANSIAENFKVSRPAISQHIKLLSECGLIVINQNGRERICSIQPKKLAEVADWIDPFRRLWEDKFHRLDNILNKLKKKKYGK
jgi:DNA-binding transcriptional ArsR family regulator